MEERFKFRRVNEITGTFVLVIVAVLIAAVVWTGRSQRWFKSSVTLRIVLPEAGAAGIRDGSEVYFLGTLVGSVSGVVVDKTGRMEAEASIRRDFFRFVRTDSSAAVKKKFGVAGDSFFEITRGEGRPLPEENASIVCNEQFQSELEAAVDEIRGQALLVLKKTDAGLDTWTKLGADLGETQKHLDQLSVHLENMAAGMEAGKGTAGRLITDDALADEAQRVLTRVDTVMGELQGAVTNLNAAAKNVRDGTVRLPEITDAVANETKDLPGLVLQTKSSMTELERVAEALQRQWPIRKHVNQTNPPPVRPLPAGPEPEKKAVKAFHSPKDPAN
jgi:phospholipid/cholesterol/gamma-HCH transport system substrate-binding protein